MRYTAQLQVGVQKVWESDNGYEVTSKVNKWYQDKKIYKVNIIG